MPLRGSSGTAAIVLAAGASTRLGQPKQLVEHAGVPLIRLAAIAASEAGASPVIVVLGADAERVMTALENLDAVQIVPNPDWHTGLASSLRRGLEAASESEGVLITLADQPLVDAKLLRILLEAFGPGRRIIASAYEGTIGVPIVVGREHFPALMQLEGDHGAGKWLRSAPGVTPIPFAAPSLDIDTPADVARLRAMTENMNG